MLSNPETPGSRVGATSQRKPTAAVEEHLDVEVGGHGFGSSEGESQWAGPSRFQLEARLPDTAQRELRPPREPCCSPEINRESAAIGGASLFLEAAEVVLVLLVEHRERDAGQVGERFVVPADPLVGAVDLR